MSKKNFDKWNIKKKNINGNISNLFVSEREIWWCSLGVNVGREQDGHGNDFERPIVIMKILSPDTLIAVPLSTKKRIDKFQAVVTFGELVNYGLLDQLRVIDSKRLVRKIGMVGISEFKEIKRKLIGLI
ncbi:MAG: type II toxin-antitoxin system PemK/MazF family toxin [Candidatus Paceibacteria bacterium]